MIFSDYGYQFKSGQFLKQAIRGEPSGFAQESLVEPRTV